MPREAGDIPCGGLPAIWHFSREILTIPELPAEQKNLILNVHRCLTDMVDVRLPEYPARLAANVNKDINIRYLMNEMEEADWQKALEQRETKFERKREIGQILTTFAHVGAEFIRGLINAPGVDGPSKHALIAKRWNETVGKQVEDLRLYTNKSLVELGKRMCCAIPQVDRRWNYVPPRREGLAEPPTGPPVINNVQAAALAGQVAGHLHRGRREEARVQAQPPQNRFEPGDFLDDDAIVVE
jgi:hypothetical protein